jgi:hypothetical protein
LERDHHARAIQQADRAARTSMRTQIDIMRARRAALAHLIAGIAEARSGRISAARSRLDIQRELDVGGDPIQRSWRQALGAEIALAEGRVDVAEAAFRDAATRSCRALRFIPWPSCSRTIFRFETGSRAPHSHEATCSARSTSSAA